MNIASDTKVIIVDDASDTTARPEPPYNGLGSPRWMNDRIAHSYGFKDSLIVQAHRGGVAKAKNACLRALRDCDHIFLLDDDIFPQREGWQEFYVDVSEWSGCQYLTYAGYLGDRAKVVKGVCYYRTAHPTGQLQYLTNHALQTVGAVEEHYGLFGTEHVSWAWRMNKSGVQNGHPMQSSPAGASYYIYCYDLDWSFRKIQPALKQFTARDFSTIRDYSERMGLYESTCVIYEETRAYGVIYVPLDGPIPQTPEEFKAYAVASNQNCGFDFPQSEKSIA